MKKALQYFDDAFAAMPDNAQTYKFRKAFLDDITERANELTHSGLKDENVISDIIISEHPDVAGEFAYSLNEAKRKKLAKLSVFLKVAGSVLWFIITTILFFVIAWTTRSGNCWLVFEIGGTAWLIWLCIEIIDRLSRIRSIFHPLSRILMGLSIMLASVSVFLVMLFCFNIIHSWLAILAGVIVMQAADALYAHHALRKFAVFFCLLYIPISSALLYVILSIAGITAWSTGWLLILGGLAVDAIIVISRLAYSRKESEELEVAE